VSLCHCITVLLQTLPATVPLDGLTGVHSAQIEPQLVYVDLFKQQEITSLGHKLSGEGIAPLDYKVASVRDWPVPTNHYHLQLGSIR
jgi:hypothetical protein